jgi:DNA-binding MarR family transcriptional regulator
VRQAEQLRYLILAAQREGNRRLARELKPLGLTPSQAEVIRVLRDNEPLTLSELGQLLVCESGTNPSRLVDRLVAGGLVTASVSPSDRRQLVLRLTDAGSKLESDVRGIEDRMYAEMDAAAAGVDLSVTLAVLGGFVAGMPAGIALEKRMALS